MHRADMGGSRRPKRELEPSLRRTVLNAVDIGGHHFVCPHFGALQEALPLHTIEVKKSASRVTLPLILRGCRSPPARICTPLLPAQRDRSQREIW